VLLAAALPWLAGCAPDQVQLPADTPYFALPSLAGPMLGAAEADTLVPVSERRWLYLGKNPYAGGRPWHPVMLCTRMHQVQLPDGRTVWFSPNVRTDVTRTLSRFVRTSRPGVLALAAAAGAAWLALAGWLWRSGRGRRLLAAGPGTRSD